MEQSESQVERSTADLFNHMLLLIFTDQWRVDVFILNYGASLWLGKAKQWMSDDPQGYRDAIAGAAQSNMKGFLQFLLAATTGEPLS